MRRAVHIVAVALLLAACAKEKAPTAAPTATGLLVLEELGPPMLTRVDLNDSQTEEAFAVPSGGFAYELDVQDDTGEILLAYTLPPTGGGPGYDRSVIVRIDDEGTIHPVAGADVAGSWCFYPVWGRNQQAWFVQTGDGVAAPAEPTLTRVDLSTGDTEAVVVGATEPAVSSDGAALAWVTVDPDTGDRTLALGDGDAQLVRTLVPTGDHLDIGQPFFSPDGQTLYYVAITQEPSTALRWLADLVIPSAHAHSNHDLPADWWQVPVDGGAPTRLTNLNTVHYDGRADPAGDWLFIATREGVRQVSAATGESELVLKSRTIRALDWLPAR